ncbi:hypothetical protein DFH27DRAFT_61970 [Peziza echinospora]|nr:hypothetical protein DFH27DRAFT_61970 [Peziza echinospora]
MEQKRGYLYFFWRIWFTAMSVRSNFPVYTRIFYHFFVRYIQTVFVWCGTLIFHAIFLFQNVRRLWAFYCLQTTLFLLFLGHETECLLLWPGIGDLDITRLVSIFATRESRYGQSQIRYITTEGVETALRAVCSKSPRHNMTIWKSAWARKRNSQWDNMYEEKEGVKVPRGKVCSCEASHLDWNW